MFRYNYLNDDSFHMFSSDEELNNHINIRTHRYNQKSYLKYHINKNLYDLFSYCIIYPNIFEIEFFTLNPNYKQIWEWLKDDEPIRLVDCEYDVNYHCYTVSVFCPRLVRYLEKAHDYHNKISEEDWIKNCIDLGYSEHEARYGYSEYMEGYIRWFKNNVSEFVEPLLFGTTLQDNCSEFK